MYYTTTLKVVMTLTALVSLPTGQVASSSSLMVRYRRWLRRYPMSGRDWGIANLPKALGASLDRDYMIVKDELRSTIPVTEIWLRVGSGVCAHMSYNQHPSGKGRSSCHYVHSKWTKITLEVAGQCSRPVFSFPETEEVADWATPPDGFPRTEMRLSLTTS
ncbi:hypothetical protein B0T17DRAFT_71507 [Bombardia bombarda]|uniref:Secreted protein n=1 Tax=Bombardia bombarda TaxID=252184 RepID=A0AA39XLE8_9PEZI|nr:hypothetical protein B0T17DRAFT_71507 [Bombardia bombarda]